MSLILDALNKSEQERAGQEDSASIHSPQPIQPANGDAQRRRRGLLKATVLALLLLVVYLAVKLYTGAPDTVPASTQQAAPAQERPLLKPVQQPVEAVVPVSVTPTQAPEANTPELPAPEPLAPEASLQAQAKPQPKTAPSEAVMALYQQAPVDEEAAPERAAAPVEAKQVESSEKPTPAPTEDKNAQWIKVPLISQLPPRVKGGIASIDYSVHMYSGQSGASFVHLNGEKRREGEMVAPGLKLVKIFEHGVVLEHQGTRFRLLPLSGWINM